jgi:hypothetical protein
MRPYFAQYNISSARAAALRLRQCTPMMAAPSFAAALAAALAGCAAAATNSSSSGVPNYHGCLTAEARSFEYCDLNLTHEERSHSLISELSLVEKVGLISPDPSLGDTCFAHIHGIPRVDLPPYGWLVECNTGVASSCYAPGQCSTTFAGPTGLGASFDRSSWTAKGTVLSTEMRAFSNHNWHRSTGVGDLIGTSAFGPNLVRERRPLLPHPSLLSHPSSRAAVADYQSGVHLSHKITDTD